MSTFFTSDLHFNHVNLITNIRHMTVEENNKLIIDNWNKVVHKKDVVYILGDITMENHRDIAEFIKQLKGIIYVIGGNHDTRRCCTQLALSGIPVMGCIDYHHFILSHMPVDMSNLCGKLGNIHGHIHLSGVIKDVGVYDPPQLDGPYYNVNTEFHQYTPVDFEDIKMRNNCIQYVTILNRSL